MNLGVLRTFSYWCFGACVALFALDLSTQQISARREAATDLSFSDSSLNALHSLGDSAIFLGSSFQAGVEGSVEAAVELIPYLIDTSTDIMSIVYTSMTHPIEAFEKCHEKITSAALTVMRYFSTLDWNTLQRYYRFIYSHYDTYCQLPAAERGERLGHLIGYHLTDFFGGSLAVKALFHVKKYAYVKQLAQSSKLNSLLHVKPSERVKGFAIAVNQATRRERYMYELKHSFEPYSTHSHGPTYGPADYDGMRLLLDFSPLRTVETSFIDAQHLLAAESSLEALS